MYQLNINLEKTGSVSYVQPMYNIYNHACSFFKKLYELQKQDYMNLRNYAPNVYLP